MTRKLARRFTDTEDQIIRDLYPVFLDHQQILTALPGRALDTIRSRARNINVSRDLRYIRRVKSAARFKADYECLPLTNNQDARHVAACLAEGGFPNVRLMDGRTVWIWPVGRIAAAA